MWKDRNGNTHYSSFGEITERKRHKNESSLKGKQEKFAGVCSVCKQPMKWINGTNVVVCQNPDCTGIVNKNEKKEKGEDIPYEPVARLLTPGATSYAEYLYE